LVSPFTLAQMDAEVSRRIDMYQRIGKHYNVMVYDSWQFSTI
jgi:hypothetical protein